MYTLLTFTGTCIFHSPMDEIPLSVFYMTIAFFNWISESIIACKGLLNVCDHGLCFLVMRLSS